ncbi:MAG TPA: hypothetical protein VFG64_05095 [Dongiaceae bacterium]|jgi:hypothetical protein|nr:hypothetical protein [Dongiaceae bacterium]
MAGFDLVSVVVIALAVGGLAAVLGEILVKDPRSLGEIVTDSRRFAEAPLPGSAVSGATGHVARPATATARPAANANSPRLVA